MKWQTAPRWLRVAIVLGTIVVGFNVGLRAVDTATSGAERSGSDSDPTSTAPNGTSAWSRLLEVNGVPVDHRSELATPLDSDTTIVVLDVPVESVDAVSLRTFVAAGGRLVTGGSTADSWFGAILDDPPSWSPRGARSVVPTGRAAETDGVTSVATSGHGSWGSLGSSRALLGDDGTIVAALASVGAGTVVALADTSIVQNQLLATDDNAAFALDITRGPVMFVDLRQTSRATGLAALPDRWKLALIGLVVAFGVGAVALGRRTGPPDPPGVPVQPARRTYVDAIGLALERTRDPAEALAGLRRHVRAELARRAGLGAETGDTELRAAASRLGWSPREIDAVVGTTSNATIIDAGRALARVAPTPPDRATNEGAGT